MKRLGHRLGLPAIILAAWPFCWQGPVPPAGAHGDQTSPPELGTLSAADKAELVEIKRLKAELGDQVWPGLSGTDIPLIFYDQRFEFLVGEASPPSPWQAVGGDDFLGRPYFRRPAQDPQSFAIKVGTRWAGSIGTLELMNSKTQIRFSREFHAVLMLHEVFHAFQATLAPERFAEAMSLYKSEKEYPYKDPEFSAGWNSEGEALADALRAKEIRVASALAQKFLKIRDGRRRMANLSSGLAAYERGLEWLEGLGKYAEVRFYELARSRADQPAYSNYRTGHPFWASDLAQLRAGLGRQGGDLRFYLSGAAQALLLDRLLPGWKSKPMRELTDLEDCLRASLAPD